MSKPPKHESESEGYVTFDRSGVTVDIVRYFESKSGKNAIDRLKKEQQRLQALMPRPASDQSA